MEKLGAGSFEVSGEKEISCLEGQDELSEDVTSQLKQLSVHINQNVDEEEEVDGGGDLGVGVFPEELWMKILDEVVDSKDILSVLRAFPMLDKAFQTQKASWLFGLVLPHLMSKHLVKEASGLGLAWIHSQELLKLRRVSKRWKNAVENSLQNHADRHPHLPRGNTGHTESNVVTIPENHFNYHHIWLDCRLGSSILHEAKDINNFLQEMANHHGNPFPGKSVVLPIWQNSNFRQALASCVTLLERFGEHVLDLEIEYRAYGDAAGDLELCRNILRCLALVPNLRSLIFSGQLFCWVDDETNELFGTPESQALFPELVNLKRFEWRVRFDEESNWTSRMVETYGKKNGLRKLGIPLNPSWTENLASHPSIQLTELHLFLDPDFDIEVDRIEYFVKALPNHQNIRKFCLSSLVTPFAINRVNIQELIGVLAKFQFESVILQDLGFEDEPSISELLIPPATSITSLVLEEKRGRCLNFDFLELLPNLEFLSVFVSSTHRTEALREYRKDVRNGVKSAFSLGKILRMYYLKAYDPTLEIPESWSIWQQIPSLKMLNVAVQIEMWEIDMVCVQFVRECGNKAFFGPRPDVMEWNDEEPVFRRMVEGGNN